MNLPEHLMISLDPARPGRDTTVVTLVRRVRHRTMMELVPLNAEDCERYAQHLTAKAAELRAQEHARQLPLVQRGLPLEQDAG